MNMNHPRFFDPVTTNAANIANGQSLQRVTEPTTTNVNLQQSE
jgi:hypothetical protein